jgi:hypothetical protein
MTGPTELELAFTREYSAAFPPDQPTPTLEESRSWVDAWWAAHPHELADAPTLSPDAAP